MITIQTQLSYDQLMEAVGQLSLAELEELQNQVIQLRASRHSTSLPKSEADLLLKINGGSSPQSDSRYQELLAKRQEESLTESEYQELIVLSDQYEQQNAERMKYIVQLSSIRGISLTELMDQLEIPQPAYD